MDDKFTYIQNEILNQHALDALLVTNPSDVYYLSGFHSSNCVLIFTKNQNLLLTDSRYTLIAQTVTSGYEVLECNTGLIPAVKQVLADNNCKNVGIQDQHVTLEEYLAYSADAQFTFLPIGNRLTLRRAVKVESELTHILAAQAITDQAFSHMLDFIQPGQTEKEIALELEYTMKKLGAEKLSFDSIVASGPNSAMPHAVPGQRRLEKGDMLTMDFGCVVNSYCSDMTRTVAIGQPMQQLLEVYNVVLHAHEAAKQALRPGAKANDVDAVARGYIASKGYGAYFGHGLGHGVGIDIHELPVLSYRADTVLQPGNVVTIEPGIYIPGLGGVRIENMCFITDSGYLDITKSDKNLIIL